MFGLFSNPLELVLYVVALIAAIAFHEFAHAFVADYLGDPTPRLQGRLTLNPLAHLDPIGTLMLVIARFGWGKPVQFDPYNLRHPRRDSAIISIAGPISNFLFATVCSIVVRLLMATPLSRASNSIGGLLVYVFIALLQSVIMLNVMLGVFNLVPIHPLDGFKIVEGILPEEYARQWHELQPYGLIFLLFLAFPILSSVAPLSQVITPVINGILKILLPGMQF